MYRIFFLAILFLSTAHAASFIGVVVPPYPEGVVSNSGACVSKALGLLRVCDYSIGVLEKESGEMIGIYLGQKDKRDAEGRTTWKIIDQIAYPAIGDNQALMLATCRQHGEDEIDESIIAVAEISNKEWLSKIKWAYQASFSSNKFIKANPKSIKCINDAFGNE